jgi:Sec-independent protein translocase protein TatA
MLDNLGFGEFFALGLLLFLFFGPERLPQMGAQLGRWVSNLTRYSGAFMEEWREEALAVHDAMEQVRGMRDEIAAARAEIAGTLHEARDDLGGAVEGARQDVGRQVQRATRLEVVKGPAEASVRDGPAPARLGAPGSRRSPPGDSPAHATVAEGYVAVEGPSPAEMARLREQVHELRAEMDGLGAAVAAVREGLEARAPAGVGQGEGVAVG